MVEELPYKKFTINILVKSLASFFPYKNKTSLDKYTRRWEEKWVNQDASSFLLNQDFGNKIERFTKFSQLLLEQVWELIRNFGLIHIAGRDKDNP